MAAAPAAPVQARLTGKVSELRQEFGWIVPAQAIQHPAARWNHGRIFLALPHDVRPGFAPKVGDVVEFSLYADKKGLGAEDCSPAQADSDTLASMFRSPAPVTTTSPKPLAKPAECYSWQPSYVEPWEETYARGGSWSSGRERRARWNSKWSYGKSWNGGGSYSWAAWGESSQGGADKQRPTAPRATPGETSQAGDNQRPVTPRQSHLEPADSTAKDNSSVNLSYIFSDSEDTDDDAEKEAFPTVCGKGQWRGGRARSSKGQGDEDMRHTSAGYGPASPNFSDKTLSTAASPSEVLPQAVRLYKL
jgi:hypothetical protein